MNQIPSGTVAGEENSDVSVTEASANRDQQEFAQRIEQLAEDWGGIPALSKIAGVSERTVRNWAGGKSDHSRDNLVTLRNGSWCALEWLMTGNGRRYEPLPLTGIFGTPHGLPPVVLRGVEEGLREQKAANALVLVPRYNLKLGAGRGMATWEVEQIAELGFTAEWLQRKGIAVRDAGLAEVAGPSMEGMLYDGDLVLFDRGDIEVRSGKCYALRVGDELLVKYLSHIDGGLLVSSENSAMFPPFKVALEDPGHVQVIGRIRSSSREWD